MNEINDIMKCKVYVYDFDIYMYVRF